MGSILKSPIFRKGSVILLHPLSLSLIATIIILLIFPVNIPKYRLNIVESNRSKEPDVVYWEDLEEDGISDFVFFGYYPIGYTVAAVYFWPSGRVKEWDIPGKPINLIDNHFFTIGQVMPGGGKEIFVFSQSHDSVFLNRITDFSDQRPNWEQRFIATCRLVNGAYDIIIVFPRLEDLDGDSIKELIFGINTGFSIAPRALFIYNFKMDTIYRSIETGSYLSDFLIADITGDQKKEIITMGYAPQNILDTVVTYHDSSNWVMVFDDKLRLIFAPAEFEGRTGSTSAIGLPSPAGEKLHVLWVTPTSNPHQVQLFRITEDGEKRFVKEFSEFDKKQTVGENLLMQFNNEFKWVFPLKNGDICLFDTTFRDPEVIHLNQPITYLKPMDVDLDGIPEFLAIDEVLNTLTIYRNDFSHPASVNVEFWGIQHTIFSLKKIGPMVSILCISTGNLHYKLSYLVNPYWYTRPAIWAAIWFTVFLFTSLIRKIQRIQIEKRFATEKKITELQLKIVKNQMDPHFTMNAINSIIAAIRQKDQDSAAQSLMHFSQMYRSLVLSGDRIQRSLAEELEFTKNYLELEKFRFKDQFGYQFEIAPETNLSMEIPKMIVQTPVENAVKHGLLHRESGGLLTIRVIHVDHFLRIEVEDNGIGRQASGTRTSTGTGKGLQIMQEFLDLYEKITGTSIPWEVTDLSDDSGKPAGTRVVITIPVS
ncbi:MAG: histidine kinase [Bacteroidales bacterium]|nr:histidine kinase [Bacteroidales bacterium]